MRTLTIVSSIELTKSQRATLEKGISEKEKEQISFCYDIDRDIAGIQVFDGERLLDVSARGELGKVKKKIDTYLSSVQKGLSLFDIPKMLKEKMRNLNEQEFNFEVFGRVISLNDGIVHIQGLSTCKYKEIVLIGDKGYALVMNLERNKVGAIILSGEESIEYGDIVFATGKVIEVPVGEGFLGRVIDSLGQPLDGRPQVVATQSRNIEAKAPRIIDRDKVNEPLYTGILAIDSMIPIGKGQRELIIGDRQTGKTSIIADTIINQKGKNVYCIYVAIGQRASSVSELVKVLEERGAMEYTTIVVSTAADNAAFQYIAPYTGAALADYFMHEGKDVLIAYDDLTKHAVAYRTISLLLKRPAGREAFPGDIFYIHSKLLERAAKLNKEHGGGSITALPVVETQAGDISSYIPTNIISITDGQVYLQKDLFNMGQRPAINVGLSVSRIGGSAQTQQMRVLSSRLRLDIAHYRELANFSQFGSSVDSLTKEILFNGKKIEEAICQTNYKPYDILKELIYLYVITNKKLVNIPHVKVQDFMKKLYQYIVDSKKIVFKNDLLIRDILDELISDYTSFYVEEK